MIATGRFRLVFSQPFVLEAVAAVVWFCVLGLALWRAQQPVPVAGSVPMAGSVPAAGSIVVTRAAAGRSV